MFRTLDELDAAQRVLARVDLNSPIEDGAVVDNRRFSRHAVTLAELAAADHRVAVLAHQGRPGGDSFVSLEGHAAVLESHLERPVDFVPETCGDEALAAIRELDAGDVLLLENVRMTDDELADRTPKEHAECDLVQTLAPEFDAYVGDAYSTAHREHASIVGFPLAMDDAYAGRVMEAEYTANSAIQSREFDGPVTMVLGGTKADDLIHVMARVDAKVDTFLLGGIVGELFLRAAGHDVGYDVRGTDFFDAQWDEHRDTIEELLERYGDRIQLPTDLAYADAEGQRAEVAVEEASKATSFLDVGAGTVDAYRSRIEGADAVFVKGALGVFEDERFSRGTVGVLDAIARSDAFSVVGGGDTSRAVDLYALDPAAFSHVSIAGGAYVRALTGEPLPGVEVLSR